MNHTSEGSRQNEYQITLNFLPIEGKIPDFVVYRKLRALSQDTRPCEDVPLHSLPEEISCIDDNEKWKKYWISYRPREGFSQFDITEEIDNNRLNLNMIYYALLEKVKESLHSEDYLISEKSFFRQIEFVQERRKEGHEAIIVEPRFLRSEGKLGFLINYHFHIDRNVKFSKDVQRWSLALTDRYARNLNYYSDKWERITKFINDHRSILDGILPPGAKSPITCADNLISIPAYRLRRREYIFGGNKRHNDHFRGLRSYTPLKRLDESINLVFIFREEDRQLARHLAKSLIKPVPTFPGFNALFKCQIIFDENPVVLDDLSQRSFKIAVEKVKEKKSKHSTLVPIVILPEGRDSYLVQKSLFSSMGVASQVCKSERLMSDDGLKWSISNIALQIFCKAGGQPWKVMPTHDHALIIGISQSHKYRDVNGERIIEKYFAFSIMTDNSGIFQGFGTLGEGEDQENYIASLKKNLKQSLRKHSRDFSRIVIHTSFKLKDDEMRVIRDTVEEFSDNESSCHFAVVKINQRHHFFGVNEKVNSLIPYESTYTKLGPREYLIWFEGRFSDSEPVSKSFPAPTHLNIIFADKESIPDDTLLQDLVNLSGANWRGFNAKNSPVSVLYCRLVAKYIREFNEHNLPVPNLEDVPPWFL